MTKDELKAKVLDAIERRKEEIIAIGEDIFRHPELGYKEFRTAAIVEAKFQELGVPYQGGIAITGSKGRLTGRRSEVNMAVMGELDSVLCPGHEFADPQTGAAHSCGHNGQIAAMLGVAMGLVDSGAMDELDGDVSLIAVPAEEYVEIEYRNKLRRQGKIQFLGGKQEFIALGAFDDVDLSMMMHLGTMGDKVASVGGTNNGFIGKFIQYKGKEAHAGGAPHLGVNALNAAILGLMGIHAQRETLKDQDTIRIHPIINKGGDLVNVIPADVRMETYVRGKTIDGIMDASVKVDRALKAGAYAIGAEVEITDLPGYLPRFSDETMDALFEANLATMVGGEKITHAGHSTGSTDMGDVVHLMPGIHPHMGGVEGVGHSENYTIVDPYTAYVVSAKAMATTVIDLLWNGAERALQVKRNYRPIHTKESYLKMWEDLLKK